MKRAALYSAIFHSVLLIILIIGFSNPFHRVSLMQQPLMIEVAEIREISTAPKLAPESQEAEKKSPVPEPKPKPPEPPQSKPEAPQKPEKPSKPVEDKAEPAAKEEETIPLQKSKPKKETPKPPKEKKEKPQPKKAEVDLTKKPEKSQTKEKTNNKKDESFDNLLDDVLQDDADKPLKTVQGAPAAKVGDIMSMSEMDALRRRIYKCWIVPAGARGAKDLTVDIDMEISPDGTVLKADIANASRMNTDSFYRAAAESAKRAVLDPSCNPLPLPADKYDQWKQLTLSFNPKDMF